MASLRDAVTAEKVNNGSESDQVTEEAKLLARKKLEDQLLKELEMAGTDQMSNELIESLKNAYMGDDKQIGLDPNTGTQEEMAQARTKMKEEILDKFIANSSLHNSNSPNKSSTRPRSANDKEPAIGDYFSNPVKKDEWKKQVSMLQPQAEGQTGNTGDLGRYSKDSDNQAAHLSSEKLSENLPKINGTGDNLSDDLKIETLTRHPHGEGLHSTNINHGTSDHFPFRVLSVDSAGLTQFSFR